MTSVKRILNRFTAYHWGLLLSGLSALLGVLREIILVSYLGFSQTNDHLQLYIAIIFATSLFNESLGLSCLATTRFYSLRRVLEAFTPFFLLLSLGIAGIYFLIFEYYLPYWLLAVSIALANMYIKMLTVFKQRYGSYVKSIAINILPNFLLVPTIILLSRFHISQPTPWILMAYSSICLMQLMSLSRLKIHIEPFDTALEKPPNAFKYCLSTVSKYLMLAPGQQLYALLVRYVCLDFGTGYLSIYSLAERCYLTTKFVVIDSYALYRLRKNTPLHFQDLWQKKALHGLLWLANFSIIILWLSLDFNKLNFLLFIVSLLLINLYALLVQQTGLYELTNHKKNTLPKYMLCIDLSLILCSAFLYWQYQLSWLLFLSWYFVRTYLYIALIQAELKAQAC